MWRRLAIVAALLVIAQRGGECRAAVGSGEVRIRGVALHVAPADPADELTRPRNAPVVLTTRVVDGAGVDLTGDATFAGTRVVGTLSGRDVEAEVSAPLGEDLEIGTATVSSGALQVEPPLLQAGNYALDDLRLVDASGATVLEAVPAALTIRVIDRVFVSNLTSRPLSLEEIRERGIVIDDDNFTAYSFTFGLGTDSDRVNINFDVLFPQDADTVDGGGSFPLPPEVPELDVPEFDVTGILLETPIELDGVDIPPIPGVLVVPGNIAFLNQFFEVVLLVSNVTPPGSQLVITEAAAELELPLGPNGVPDDANNAAQNDDPLRPAVTEAAAAGHPLCAAEIDPLLWYGGAERRHPGRRLRAGRERRGALSNRGRPRRHASPAREDQGAAADSRPGGDSA